MNSVWNLRFGRVLPMPLAAQLNSTADIIPNVQILIRKFENEIYKSRISSVYLEALQDTSRPSFKILYSFNDVQILSKWSHRFSMFSYYQLLSVFTNFYPSTRNIFFKHLDKICLSVSVYRGPRDTYPVARFQVIKLYDNDGFVMGQFGREK